MIESVNNERIKEYAKLHNKKYRDKEGLFIVEGTHLVEEAKKLGLVKEIFSLDGNCGTRVSEPVMKKLSMLDTVPNILAVVKKMESREINGNILIIDNIQDPGNLGTIIRSAVAFNIDTIVASSNTVDLYNSKVIRSSEGMCFKINYIVTDLKLFINSIKNDYTIFTTNVSNGENIKDISFESKYAIIMGNEGAGVSSDLGVLSDRCIYIPMNNNCESLNVGVATSIILYEFSNK